MPAVQWAFAAIGVGLLSGCRTQRWPEPMPLPPGGAAALESAQAEQTRSSEEVICVRHADPVNVRHASELSGFPLSFYDHRERLQAGAWVVTGAGGRAEIIWPEENLSIELFDSGALQIGERDRDEPAARILDLSTARIRLTPGQRVQLEGGAILAGDPDLDSGPFVIEQRYESALRVYNRSKRTGYISFREETLSLGPGESVDLPLLAVGAEPFDVGMRSREVAGVQALELKLDGGLRSVSNGADGIRVEADTFRGTALGLGLRVALEAGDQAQFIPLGIPVNPSGESVESPEPPLSDAP